MAQRNFRPFTQLDWYGYAGCERAPDGRQPIIWRGQHYQIIADNQGVEVSQYDDAPEGNYAAFHFHAGDYDANVAYAQQLPEVLRPSVLRSMGFSPTY